ncbi:hypothetical protein [Geodermatophilus poikilotrophus]|uniref:Uncharacterized protein n=1 Tax=Geodermatophilus poikilotrophus TaxID=1333667 RepID=A0A1I0DLB2_9ACTN|nr:hypothetical protein [Geodermatophilus poikilotrophus]SET33086.1 hypothetical protein SAMN04488546_1997 [Geodermatophilus poikilotrophus]
MSDVVKVVCSRGHRRVLIGTLGHREEDLRPSIGPEDFAPESGGRLTAEDVEALTLHAGATVGPGRGAMREMRPDGGTKNRFRCPACHLDVAVSWETLNGREVARKLRAAGFTHVELSYLAASLSR